jgi:hypothetical protein
MWKLFGLSDYNMRQAAPRVLVIILSFVGLLGCGQAASDNRSSHDSPIAVSESSEIQTSSVPTNKTLSYPQPEFSARQSKPFAMSDSSYTRNLYEGIKRVAYS